MIGYATIGTNDLENARAFYDAVLQPLGGKRFGGNGSFPSDSAQYYVGAGGALLSICCPFNEKAAFPGNGNMIALLAPSRELVDQAHALAIANGAVDDGVPGERRPGFYAAYFLDLDGNKVCVFKMG